MEVSTGCFCGESACRGSDTRVLSWHGVSSVSVDVSRVFRLGKWMYGLIEMTLDCNTVHDVIT